MRNLTRIAVAVLLLAALPAGAKGGKSRGQADGTHKALVIGVANYSGIWPKLDNPIHDAKAMDAKLTAMGYTVRRLLDPTGEEMDTAASEFTRSLRDGDTAVFFYAGHGVQVDNANYLIPRDFTADTEVSVKHRAFPLSDVVESIERSEGVAGLVIVDACRTNGLKRGGRGATTRGLSAMPETHGVLIAFAASANQEAQDGTGENGLYTSRLLEHLGQPNVPVEDMLREVAKEVYQASGRKQTPAKYGNILDAFCLTGDACGRGAGAASIGDDQARLDEANAKVAREKAELEATRLEAEKAKLASEKAELAAKLARQKAAPVVASVATSDSGDTFQAAGHEWQTKPAANSMNWEAAKSCCAGQGGGWRLPDEDELKALYDAKQSSSEIASKPGMAGGWYWSSTPGENGGAWLVNFVNGHVYADNVPNSGYVRCVR
jgi:uncharacterized caspase-like protein